MTTKIKLNNDDNSVSEINQTIHKIEAFRSHMKKGTCDIRQIAADAELLLTPVQRGKLQWSATMKGSTEKTIVNALDEIISELKQSKTSLKPAEVNWKPEIPSNITSTISQFNSSFRWEINMGGGESTQIDQRLYASADVAKEHADRFISELKQGKEQAWITYGITSWVNQQKTTLENPQTKIELLQIGANFYLLVSSNFAGQQSPTTPESMNRKTDIFSNILLEVDTHQSARESVTINPKWVARGMQSDLFYVLFQVVSCDSLSYLVYKLRYLFTKADLT